MTRWIIRTGFLAGALIAATAGVQVSMPTTVGQTPRGQALVDANGMTLYTHNRDEAGKSFCNGDCAATWHPLLATADSQAPGGYSIITRDDGTKQWAYQGHPLYTYAGDQQPGDVANPVTLSGDWRIARL